MPYLRSSSITRVTRLTRLCRQVLPSHSPLVSPYPTLYHRTCRAMASEATTGVQLSQITPEKSRSDKRDYRFIRLSNDLECLLVSDPETDKSA